MGDVTVMIRTDLLIYSIIFDLTLIIFLKINSFKNNHSSLMMCHTLIAMAVLKTFELISWLTGDFANTAQIPIHYWSNFLYIGLLGVPAAFGLKYFNYKIYQNLKKSRRALFLYLIPAYIGLGFAIYNIFNDGFLFYINENNQYFRGIGVPITVGTLYVLLAVSLAFFYKDKKLVTGRITGSILVFSIFPVAGSILQNLFYGTTYGMSSYTLAAFIIFLIMEKDEMGKDELTGLYNRQKLVSRLRYKLKAREPFTLIMADVNNLKYINDKYGHLAGDKTLIKTADVLNQLISSHDMVCRFGGDEFLILIENDENIGEKIVTRINSVLEKVNQTFEYPLSITCGYEFVPHPAPGNIDDLLHSVDLRMYENK